MNQSLQKMAQSRAEIRESMIAQLSPSTEQKINEMKTQYGLQGTSTNLLLLGILAPITYC